MGIFKELRRRSKASFKTDRSTSSSNDTTAHAPQTDRTYTTSPVESVNGGATPPTPLVYSHSASSLQQLSTSQTPQLQQRPTVSTSYSNRYSVSGMSGLGSAGLKSSLPASPYAPRILNVADQKVVYQKILSVHGVVGDSATRVTEGTITVSRVDDAYPQTQWPVADANFKALVYLLPGPNRLRFDFTSPKLTNGNTTNPIHSTHMTILMVPPQSAPPLQLVILLGKDSPGTFDSTPARMEREGGNGIDIAIRKFRMAAYLWQAFTAEQMLRNQLGRRTFRFEEEWMTGTTNARDLQTGTMRSEAKIHVIRSSKTVAELRDPNIAQQNKQATRTGDLFSFAMDDVKSYFKPTAGQKQYVSVLILDAHWDKQQDLILGHAALGGGGNDIGLAIFGSQALHTYPSTLEEVVSAFSDCTPTDTAFVANDCNESGSAWEAANIGIGAHLHETGHLFGCPHQASGIMLRDYVTLNRSFTVREPFSTRTKSKGGVHLKEAECAWHRLDALRFRSHPCFALPGEPPRHSDESIQVWPIDNGNVIITAASGIAHYEITPHEDGELCRYWEEVWDGQANKQVVRHFQLNGDDVRKRLPEHQRKSKIKMCIKSVAGGSYDVDDFDQLISNTKLKLKNGQVAFRSGKLGLATMEGTQAEEIVFYSTLHQVKLMTQVKIYHGFALDGIEFFYEDSTSQLFGKRGGTPGGSDFNLDTRRGELITGFYVRSGAWVDGIAIITSLGRKSIVYGNANGGSGHTLIVPRGYSIAGINGSCANWVDSFGILITR